MSEVEKAPMDKRNISSRQLALPSSRSNSENGSSVNKFPGSHQKGNFSSVSNESTVSKKYPQPREKVNFKENGGSVKKFGLHQRRDLGSGSSLLPSESGQSKKFSHLRERCYEMGTLQQVYNGGPQGRRNGCSAKGNMSLAQSQNVGYRPWKDKTVGYLRYGVKVPYSKEQFLQANCQFVVRKNGNYAVHTSNPDTLVDWDLIEQVRIFDHEVPSCPICLYPPKAAKITRCGHSYCWPCMLHYMSLFDENYVNCPICFARVREKDLKSVVALQTINFNIGQEITMKLMKKNRGRTLVSPRHVWNSELDRPFSVTDVENTSYAKLLTADLDDIQKILEAEQEELVMLLQEDNPDTLEGSFITAAMKLLEQRVVNLKHDDLTTAEPNEACLQDSLSDDILSKVSPVNQQSDLAMASKRYVSAFSDEEEAAVKDPQCDAILTDLPEGGASEAQQANSGVVGADSYAQADPTGQEDIHQSRTRETSISEPKALHHKNRKERSEAAYFYQSADGQHIYMHGVNVSCLKAQYGDLSNCPDELTAKIVDLERIFMDEVLRKKYRWLNHLPLTCEFIMAELELKPPLVSQEVLDLYAAEISKRQQERERKQRYDNQRTQRIQKEECRRMGIDPHSRIVRSEFKRGVQPSSISSMEAVFCSLSSVAQWDQVEEQLTTSPDSLAAECHITEDAAECGVSRNSCSSEESSLPSVPSFAQMLKMGNPKPVSLGLPEKAAKASDDKDDSKWSDSDGEQSARPPAYQFNFMCDLGQKLAELDCAGNTEDVCSELPTSGKKKKKVKLLFTSGHMLHNKRV